MSETNLVAVLPAGRSSLVMQHIDTIHHLPRPILDISWGIGRFWKRGWEGGGVIGLDKYAPAPQIRGDWLSLPIRDAVVGTVVFDPPHSAADTGATSAHLRNSYGNLSEWAWKDGRYPDYTPVFREVARIASCMVVKAADMIHSGSAHWLSLHLLECARQFWTLDDWIISYRHPVISNLWRTQRHARKNHAHWFVLRK